MDKGVGFFVFWAVFAVVLGLLANRKNRNVLGWALIGGLFALPALLILAFLPPLCAKCRSKLSVSEWKEGKCPTCEAQEDSGDVQNSVGKTPKTAMEYLPFLLGFSGIVVGLFGGMGNVPELGYAALLGPALVMFLVGLGAGYVIRWVAKDWTKPN